MLTFINPLIFNKVKNDSTARLTKSAFINYYKKYLVNKDEAEMLFHLLKQNPNQDHLTLEDFKPLLSLLLETHPGLEFLKATPEYQERYSETVVYRIFYKNDKG